MRSIIKIFIILCFFIAAAGTFYLSIKDHTGKTVLANNMRRAGDEIVNFVTKMQGSKKISEEEVAQLNEELMDAVKEDNLIRARNLLNMGAKPDIKENTTSNTPLFAAVKNGNAEMVALLLSRGADPRQLDENGLTPLHKAIEENAYPEGAGKTPPAMIKAFIDNKVNVNIRDLLGQTPLMRACKQDRLHTASYLLESGANKKLKDFTGMTALDIAKDKSALYCVELLENK